MDRFDWLVSRGQGPSKERHLREPGMLLDAWAKQVAALRVPALRRYYVPGSKSDALIERLSQVLNAHQVGYAVSYEAAAQRYAPFLSGISQVRTRLLPDAGADAAIAELDARVVSEGSNLAVIEVKSAGELLFRQQVGGVWLASPIQVYLDLLRGEGRAKEMAEHHGRRHAQVGGTEGYRKDGPVAVAKFELGEADASEQREARALRQREASDAIEQLLARLG